MGNCFGPEPHSGKKKPAYIETQAKLKDLTATYNINEKVLGSGSYGKVFSATDKENPDFKIAVKVIGKKKLDAEDLKNLRNEVKIMQQVDHPNIVRYYETYDDKKYIYLCMELCTGGDLYKYMLSHAINEKLAKQLMMKLLKALQHVHSANIIHRDIKPENIMFGDDKEVKFIDFGFAVA